MFSEESEAVFEVVEFLVLADPASDWSFGFVEDEAMAHTLNVVEEDVGFAVLECLAQDSRAEVFDGWFWIAAVDG